MSLSFDHVRRVGCGILGKCSFVNRTFWMRYFNTLHIQGDLRVNRCMLVSLDVFYFFIPWGFPCVQKSLSRVSFPTNVSRTFP